MKNFLLTLLFLFLPLEVQAGFPEGKNGFDINKIENKFRLRFKEIGFALFE